MPRSEYTLDNAVNWIVKVNKIYNPAWIFCDRGYGDYQIERLHIYGDEHPATGLKNKVVGFHFASTIDVPNPVTKSFTKEALKPFMVNQLAGAFERGDIILSPFDETLHKQLVDYAVVRISADGKPVYTDKDEHFVDALGLAYLAFVLKFPKITGAIKEIENSTKIEIAETTLFGDRLNRLFAQDPWKNKQTDPKLVGYSEGERPGEYNKWIKMPNKPVRASTGFNNWGSRNTLRNGMGGRTLW